MPSNPPAVPRRDRACPPQAARAAPGGFLGPMTVRLCLVLLLLSGFVPGLIPGHGATALAAPASDRSDSGLSPPGLSTSGLSAPGVSPPVAPAPRPLRQELLAAVPANLPPLYVPAADGGPGGFAVELLRRVAADAGYTVRFLPTANADEAEHLLRQGRVQVLPGLGVSPAREQALGFTRPFETLPVHIFFRAGTPPLEDLDALAGKRVALVAGSIPVERLMGRAELNILLTQTLAEAIFDVLAGQADALVHLAPVVQQAASAAGVEHKLGQSARPLLEIDRALAVGRDDPQLLERLDTALGRFHDTQDFRELYRKWHPAPRPPQFSPVALWTMAALAAALTAALLAWRSISLLRLNRRLRLAVTERKQAEVELKRLHRAIEQAAEGVLITDRTGAITYINPALERMTGLSGIEAREHGLSVHEVQQTVLKHQESVVRLDEGGDVWRGTSSFARPHGQNVEMEFTVSAIRDTGGEISSFVTVCRDVTEKRLLERQLWQAQKMEALGTLAGGIAHDFNNILASIMGFTELALDDTPPESRARGSLTRVLKASSRAKELVRQILTFSRRADREQRTLLADQVIAEALRLMEASLPKDIEITASMQAHDCAILADPSQIHQIVMNLCTNAAQAMKDGGAMGVHTQVVRLGDDSTAQAHRLPAGQYLSLTVEDTGPGIAPDVLGRIFDPFFTTKDSGQGTGLGLAVVHGIVSSLGGAVFAQSEPGLGARLTVLLPTATACPGPALEPRPGSPKGRERILLVDDETDLLDLVRQTLEPLGYQVAAHSLPEDALEAFLANPQSFDLVLTDQSMPRLTGLQLAARLREVRPNLPIVLCTGLSMVIPPDRLQALGEAWLLTKPFSTGELARVVRQALSNIQGEDNGS